MGYETKLIIGRKAAWDEEKDVRVVLTDAIINLEHCNFLNSEDFRGRERAGFYLFPEGNKLTTTDKYGQPLRCIAPDDIIPFFMNCKALNGLEIAALHYLQAYLKYMGLTNVGRQKIACLLYGH